MGSSLWLLPPTNSEIEFKLHTLIYNALPALFPNTQLPRFHPHITLTSGVDSALDPTIVTSCIKITAIPEVKFTHVNIGKTFLTKVTLYLEKTEGLKALAAECRKSMLPTATQNGENKWTEESYVPHLSLVYMEDIPEEGVVVKIHEEVAKAGILFNVKAWSGGRIVLVNTSKPIDEWEIVGGKVIDL